MSVDTDVAADVTLVAPTLDEVELLRHQLDSRCSLLCGAACKTETVTQVATSTRGEKPQHFRLMS